MQFATINGIAIHYDIRHAGPGSDSGMPVLVFINSLGTDFRIWDQVRNKLSDQFTTLVYDKRGHGLSGLGHPPYSISDHVEDLAQLLRHLGLHDIVLCGLSVGGLIAQGFYTVHSSNIRGMILSNTAPRIGNTSMWASRIAAVEERGLSAMMDEIMPRWFTPAFRQDDNPAYHGYRAMFSRQPGEGYAGTCAAIRDADLTLEAPKISVPVLCIAGQQDGSTPPELVKAMADIIPGARYELLDHAAHLPCVEVPAAYAALVRSFARDLVRKRDD